ncbi:MAG: hypothetical protein HY245_03360 [Rhizobiales bacterium]|nr:hypothetical protein [Hyphomicrobiales bacterium]MBI3672464.1 hypothetical protein [Hyphomicrobiales bacterium]
MTAFSAPVSPIQITGLSVVDRVSTWLSAKLTAHRLHRQELEAMEAVKVMDGHMLSDIGVTRREADEMAKRLRQQHPYVLVTSVFSMNLWN